LCYIFFRFVFLCQKKIWQPCKEVTQQRQVPIFRLDDTSSVYIFL
jgi:hypothetical protein